MHEMDGKTRTRRLAEIGVAAIFALGFAAVPAWSGAGAISEMGMAGAYSVNLKVLPAESFMGAKAEMVRDGGAEPTTVMGPEHPNRHLVVFVKKDGKPVEDADVAISYRMASANPAAWVSLPVVRMHVLGKGLETTHYGNNVDLAAGTYSVRVNVGQAGPATFDISIH